MYIFAAFNHFNYCMWMKGLKGIIGNLKYLLYRIMTHEMIIFFFDSCILLNTFSIAFEDQIGKTPSLILNIILDAMLTLELLLKVISSKS